MDCRQVAVVVWWDDPGDTAVEIMETTCDSEGEFIKQFFHLNEKRFKWKFLDGREKCVYKRFKGYIIFKNTAMAKGLVRDYRRGKRYIAVKLNSDEWYTYYSIEDVLRNGEIPNRTDSSNVYTKKQIRELLGDTVVFQSELFLWEDA